MRKSQAKGFTLIEMSIVLVIVGLLIGIMLQGQEMIQTARVKATVTQWEKSKVSIAAFKQKYGAMPGDYSDARKKIHRDLKDGNGDGEVNSADEGEYVHVWEHLARAGMISDVEKYSTTLAGEGSPRTLSRYPGELRDTEFFLFYGIPNKGAPHAALDVSSDTEYASLELPSYTAEMSETVMFAADTSPCEPDSPAFDTDYCHCGNGSTVTQTQPASECYACIPTVLGGMIADAKYLMEKPGGTDTAYKAALEIAYKCEACRKTVEIGSDHSYTYQDYKNYEWFSMVCGKCRYPDAFGDEGSFLDDCDVCSDGSKDANFDTYLNGGTIGFEGPDYMYHGHEVFLNVSAGEVDNMYRRCNLCAFEPANKDEQWFKDSCVCADLMETDSYEADYAPGQNVYEVCNLCSPAEIEANESKVDVDLLDKCNVCEDEGASDADIRAYNEKFGADYRAQCNVCSQPEKYADILGWTTFRDACNVCDVAEIDGYAADFTAFGSSINVYEECACGSSTDLNKYLNADGSSKIAVDIRKDVCDACDVDKYVIYKNTTKYEEICVCGTPANTKDYEGFYANVYETCGFCLPANIDIYTDGGPQSTGVDLYEICACSVGAINTYVDANGDNLPGVTTDIISACGVCDLDNHNTYKDLGWYKDKCVCTGTSASTFESKYVNVYEECNYCDPAVIDDFNLGGASDVGQDLYEKCEVCAAENVKAYADAGKISLVNGDPNDTCGFCANPMKYGPSALNAVDVADSWAQYDAQCGICDEPGVWIPVMGWDDFNSACDVCGKPDDYAPDASAPVEIIPTFYDNCGTCAYPQRWGGKTKADFLSTCVCEPAKIKAFEGKIPRDLADLGAGYIDVYAPEGCDICSDANANVYASSPEIGQPYASSVFKAECSPCSNEGYIQYHDETWYGDFCPPECDPANYSKDSVTFMTACNPCENTQAKYDLYKAQTWYDEECDPCHETKIEIYYPLDHNLYNSCGICTSAGVKKYYGILPVIERCNVCDNPNSYYRPNVGGGDGLNKNQFLSECDICNRNNILDYIGKLNGIDVLDHCNFCEEPEYMNNPTRGLFETQCVECEFDNWDEFWFSEFCDACDFASEMTPEQFAANCSDLCADTSLMGTPWWDAVCTNPCEEPENYLDGATMEDNMYKKCGMCVEANYGESWYEQYCEKHCDEPEKYVGKVSGVNIYDKCDLCTNNLSGSPWYKAYCCAVENVGTYASPYESATGNNYYQDCDLCDAAYKGEAWLVDYNSDECPYCSVSGLSSEPQCDACYSKIVIEHKFDEAVDDGCNLCDYHDNGYGLSFPAECDLGAGTDPCTVDPTLPGCSGSPDPCVANPTAPACQAGYDDQHHFMHLMKWDKTKPANMTAPNYVLTGEQAFDIDRKFDDGDIGKGGIMIICPGYTAKDGATGDDEFSPLGQDRKCYTSMRVD